MDFASRYLPISCVPGRLSDHSDSIQAQRPHSAAEDPFIDSVFIAAPVHLVFFRSPLDENPLESKRLDRWLLRSTSPAIRILPSSSARAVIAQFH
jgi:hypothetical protein